MDKQSLREHMRQRLADLSLDQRKMKSALIQQHLMAYLNEIQPTSLCVFISTALEPYLDLTVLAGLVPDLYCPKYVDNGYAFVRFSADMNLVDGPYGIKEPESALVIEDDVYVDKGTVFLHADAYCVVAAISSKRGVSRQSNAFN